MNNKSLLDYWFHGGIIVLLLWVLYFLVLLGGFFFNTLFENILFTVVCTITLLPFLMGVANYIITKKVWNIKIPFSFGRIWGIGLLFVILYFIPNYLMMDMGMQNISVLLINFVAFSFIYGLVGKKLSTHAHPI